MKTRGINYLPSIRLGKKKRGVKHGLRIRKKRRARVGCSICGMKNKIVVNKASVKVRRQRFRKCKRVPLRHVCDGCLSVNRKCPFRKKYRDERAKNKRMIDMIEIIKNGDPKKTDSFITFECENCGCIWKADHLDYKVQLTDWATYLYTAHCPNCHEEAWIVKDAWYE